MTVPEKPFETYKWTWLSLMPSEGLLDSRVFLGVLRALSINEGEAYSSTSLYNDLKRVQVETSTNINLARRPDRNLFRNSGQYWRGTGLLINKTGEIQLSKLGHQVATGEVTKDEFAALMVRNTVLPNPRTYKSAEMIKWQEAGIRIKPFELILSIMDYLGIDSIDDAYLTPNELIQIVIPMAGAKHNEKNIAEHVSNYRKGDLDISGWPDCAPEANDKRLAREFLLFLANFGICQVGDSASRYDQKFSIDELLSGEITPDDRTSFLEDEAQTEGELSASRGSQIPEIIERKRIATYALQRPQQGRFRRDVLEACASGCVLTNERTLDVIEAAHIIPVQYGGSDAVGNGFCMRVDIHRLFDGGKIRIAPDGSVSLHDQIADAVSYRDLPKKITLSPFVAVENVQWRERYL